MADRAMSFRDLRRSVSHYGGWEDPSRGKGSHTMFFRTVEDGTFSYPVPTHDRTIARRYVKGLRERLRLTETDGIADEAFYSH